MAGHIQDRWYKTEVGPDGKTSRVKTERYGSGMRYRARYVARTARRSRRASRTSRSAWRTPG